jgi:YVTN family beta-propeller protein
MIRCTGAALLLLASLAGASAAMAGANSDARSLAFVPSRSQPLVTVIDTRNDTIRGRIDTSEIPYQLAVSLPLGKLVVGTPTDDTVRLFDLATLAPAGKVVLDHAPEHLQLAPAGDVLAVDDFNANSLTLVRLDDLGHPRAVHGLDEPHNLVFGSDGSRLYAANLGSNRISVIDVAGARVLSDIDIDLTPPLADDGRPVPLPRTGLSDLTVTSTGRAFVVPAWADEIAAVDLEVGIQMTTIPAGIDPWHGYATSDGRLLILPNEGEPATVSLISTDLLQEVARLPGEPDMTGAYPAWFDSVAFIPSRAAKAALVVDLDRHRRVGEIALPSAPEIGGVTADGGKLYLALPDTNQIAVIDTRRRSLLRLIDDVGPEPGSVVLAGSRNFCD